ncbi:MAG: hypothetical protein PVI03_02075 [Candidatus Thorarchaeota archaeon]|jgi:hypothetical protein
MRDPELVRQAEELGITIKGNWGDARIKKAIDDVEAMNKASDYYEDVMPPVDKFQTVEWASERASKIFAGQSPHLGMAERIGRIRAALKERGFTRWDELEITGAVDYQRYL